MIEKITYENKVSIQNNEEVAEKNKVTDSNMNEIKSVVNNNANELEYLKSENQKLKEDLKGLPKGQASGESIDLNDSAEMRVLEFEVDGNSRQQTRSGKNLLKLKQISEIKNGLDIIVENGKIVINGTCNEVTQIQIYNNEKEINVNGNYYFSTNVKNVIPNENYTWINIYNGTTQIGYLDTMSEGKSFEFEEQSITQISFSIKEGAVCNNLTFEFQLEKGVKTEFEPYGASPSPEYSSEVESCGDNVNLFDKNNANIINAYFSDIIYGNSTNKILWIPININTEYTITKRIGKVFSVAFTNQQPQIGIELYEKVTNHNGNVLTLKNTNYKYLVVYYWNVEDKITSEEMLNTIKIEKGSVSTQYSKYGQGNISFEICNRNILDISTIKIVKNQNNESRNGYYCKIPKTGKYSLILNTANTMYFGKSSNINSATTLIGSTNATFSAIYDFNKGEYFVIWGTKTDSDKIMVNLKNSQEDYIEHECQTYTIPIQQPMLEDDYFNLRNKQEIHIWEKVTISGTDLTSTNCSIEVKTNTVQCNLMNVLTNSLAINENKIKSNLFISKYGDLSDTEHIRNGSSSFPNNVVCNISKSNLTSYDLTGVQNLLNEKNLNIWYKLSTPKKILCTQEQNEILDKIENEAKTYKGVTHIYSTDKISPNMKVKYFKDIEIMIQGNGVE